MSAKTKIEADIDYQKLERHYVDIASKLVTAAAQETRNVAVTSIQRGPKSGKTYVKYKPRRVHTASSPYQPPASDTGRLASSIHLVVNDKLDNDVSTDIKYAAPLEFGTRNMAPRPFLKPAADKGKEKLNKLMKRLIR